MRQLCFIAQRRRPRAETGKCAGATRGRVPGLPRARETALCRCAGSGRDEVSAFNCDERSTGGAAVFRSIPPRCRSPFGRGACHGEMVATAFRFSRWTAARSARPGDRLAINGGTLRRIDF